MTARGCAGIMGMPVAVNILDDGARQRDLEAVFEYMRHIDGVFSTYRPDSETERLNRGDLRVEQSSGEMREVLAICEQTRQASGGYFDARYQGRLDPSGVVKGYAIRKAADLLRLRGFTRFAVDAGGDIQTCGSNPDGQKWRVGVRDPFDPERLINIVHLCGEGIATSGTYARGSHIFDPIEGRAATAVASVTVIAEDVCDADRFATAAFAMGERGIRFLEQLPGVEGYLIGLDGIASCTTGFPRFMRR
ncbi:MAG: FAD:protein FMN transferase [Chloroflexi bacterium]|nr:FAD:protein FMN transferase [Chloroflexota bacterium]